ncbi:MAG: carotenoid biosynthesis protein [Cyanobacteria bacterium P01_A01_bin.3]
MDRLNRLEKGAFAVHLGSLAFGLAGLLLVVPHPEWVMQLPTIGQLAFSWSMLNGSVVYMVSGAIAAVLMGQRTIGWTRTLLFFIVAVGLSLSAELLGTSTGFPFGDYAYLNGLGYKIAGLVPFTIPLSWFYIGFSSYLLALTVLRQSRHWLMRMEAIALGSMMLTAWDFVLDPAMTQLLVPFWEWLTPGNFFGVPLQNFGGWLLTGCLIMALSTLLWSRWGDTPILDRTELAMPLALYAANFGFAACMSVGGGYVAPLPLGLMFGLAPAMGMWMLAGSEQLDNLQAETGLQL